MKTLAWLKYQILLSSLILLLVVYPLLRKSLQDRLLLDALEGAVFLAAFLIIFTQRRHWVVAAVLGVPTLLANWSDYAVPDLPPLPVAVVLHTSAALFFAFTVITILQGVYQAPRISADGVCGALCGYLLLGLAFGHVYCLLEEVGPGSFSSAIVPLQHLQSEDDRHFLFTYFSFVTLTTVGYGDVTPVSDLARVTAIVEAILGQFYLAVLIGDLVGKKVSQALAGPAPVPDDHAAPTRPT